MGQGMKVFIITSHGGGPGCIIDPHPQWILNF